MLESNKSIIQKTRVEFFDCTRALCMFYIVGIWHMLSGYVKGDINVVTPFTQGVTYGVLACFSMISGYFLGKKPIESFSEAVAFYKKRLLRIYPLFFISCLSLLMMHYVVHIDFISSFKQFVLTIFGLSCFFSPAPSTVWFISMLLLFYALTPLINRQKSVLRKIICVVLITAVFEVINLTVGNVDSRVWMYWPFYCLGLILGSRVEIKNRFNLLVLLSSFILFVCTVLLMTKVSDITAVNYVVAYIMMTAFIVFICEVGMICEKISFLCRILKAISYGSMAAYLFHRQLFGFIKMLTGEFPIAVAYLIVLPVTFVIMYWVQLIYDKIVKKLFYKKT